MIAGAGVTVLTVGLPASAAECIPSGSDGSVSLKAAANGDYVTADGTGTKALIANRTAIGPWEEFDLVQG